MDMKKTYYWAIILIALLSIQFPGAVYESFGEEKIDKKGGAGKFHGILYVPMGPGKKVIGLDLATDKITKTIPVKPETHGLAVTKNGEELYVPSMKDFETIFVYETKTGKEVAAIDVGGTQHHVAISPDGKYAYITVMPSLLAVVDTATRRLITSLKIGAAPDSVAFTPDSRYAYITNAEDDTVSVIETGGHKIVATIEVGELPGHIVVSPDGKKVFLTNNFSEDISVIDTATNKVIDKIPAGRGVHGIAISPDGKRIIASNSGGTTYTVIDALNNKSIKEVEVGVEPEHVSILSVGGKLKIYLNVLGTHQILVIDPETDKVLKRLDVGVDPHAHAPYLP